jgi:phage internal scaffolding protein
MENEHFKRKRVMSTFEGESRTHSAFADDCNLPKKIARLVHTGMLEEALRQPPLSYGDFTNAGDYMTALMRVKAANEAFMSLPAATRREFDNDPAQLLDALNDPSKKDKLVELGVLEEEMAPPTPVAEPATPPPVVEPEP